MTNRQRKVIHLINARQVILTGKEMRLSDLEFYFNSGNVSGSGTLIYKKYDSPTFFSSMDNGGWVDPENYFLGEVEVKWQPKITPIREAKRKFFRKNFMYNDYSESLSRRIGNMKEEGFVMFLPEKRMSKEFFQKVAAKEDKISKWAQLWYECVETRFCGTVHGDFELYDKADLMEKELDSIHDELIESGLTLDDGTIIKPQYIFVFPQKRVKQACYNRSLPHTSIIPSSYKTVKRLNINWITPNVCVADSEEEFFELMRQCYGITEIYN